MNDSSNDQKVTSQSKRKILTSLGVTSGVIGASALSQNWVKPVVNSIVLPAHAQSTPTVTTTMDPGGMMTTTMEPMMTTTMDPMMTTTMDPMMTTTMEPMMTTTMDPMMTTTMEPMMTTTMEPADPPPAGPSIVLSPMAGGVVDASGATGVTVSVKVKLATEPSAPVTVTPTGDDVTSDPETLPFTVLTWDTYQVANLTIATDASPTDMDGEEGAMVTFATGTGGGYDDVEAEWTYTAGYYAQIHVTNVEATAGPVGSRSATITWDAPDTRAMVTGYRVESDQDGVTSQTVTKTRATFTTLSVAPHEFTVTAVYGTTDAAGAAPDAAKASVTII